MSENDERTEKRPRAVEKTGDGVEVVEGGEGATAGTLDPAAAEEAVPNAVAEPRSCTNEEVNDMTPDLAHAAAARGTLTAPQMKRLLGGPPLSTMGLTRRLLTSAPIGTSAAAAAWSIQDIERERLGVRDKKSSKQAAQLGERIGRVGVK